MRRAVTPALGLAPALLLMARPSQVALIVLVHVTGVLLGVWRGGDAVASASLGLGLVIAASVAIHWANEAADADTDARAVRTPFSGGSGALLRSGIDPALPMRLAGALGMLTALAGLVAVLVGALPPVAGVLLLGGLAGGFAYSVPPIAAMRRGWGEVLNALLGGMLLPLFGVAAVRGEVDASDIVAFLAFLALTLASVMATAWPDRAADAATGKRTLQVRWPVRRLRLLHLVASLGWLAAIAVAVRTEASPAAAGGLVVAPLVVLGHRWYTRDRPPWPSVAAMVGGVAIMCGTLAVVLA